MHIMLARRSVQDDVFSPVLQHHQHHILLFNSVRIDPVLRGLLPSRVFCPTG